MERHVIAIFDSETAITDEVLSPAGKLVRKAIKINDRKEAEVYGAMGQLTSTRIWAEGSWGTLVCNERSTGSVRAEKQSIFTNDGRAVSVNERVFCGALIQSESECKFNPDGTPMATTANTFDQSGRIRKREFTSWFRRACPAITEITEFDPTGNTEYYIKTMHNTSGVPLWQEKTFYPENSTKPSKKELIVFNAKTSKAIVDVSEFAPDGSVAKHVLNVLHEAAGISEEKKTERPHIEESTSASTDSQESFFSRT